MLEERDARIPQNTDAEAAVLGSCLLDREAIGAVVDWLLPSDFYDESLGQIYTAMSALYREGTPIDYVTLVGELDRTGRLESAGGIETLSSLLGAVPTPIHVEHYGKLVANVAVARRLIRAGGRIATLGYHAPDDPDQLMAAAERCLEEVRGHDRATEVRPWLDLLRSWLDESVELQDAEAKGARLALPSGWIDFDKVAQGGLQRSNLVVLAGRPGLGKTAAALAIGTHAAVKLRVPVLMFSIEMAWNEIVGRVVAAESRINPSTLRKGNLDRGDEAILGEVLGRLSDLPFWVDDSGIQTLGSIRARTRRLAQHTQIGLVIVDHLQLVSGNRAAENRTQEVAEISRGLKALAREIQAPVLVVSQLNRAVESRTNKRPLLSDLRESGAIEQDADLVVLLYRDDYYNAQSEAAGVAELHIAKQRNGPTGLVELYFDRPLGRFLDLDIAHTRSA